MTDARSVDDILVNQGKPINEQIVNEEVLNAPEEQNQEYDLSVPAEETQNDVEIKSEVESDVDEFGNQVSKPKMYTEEEVNEMIRRRIKNSDENRHQSQPQQQSQQQQPETIAYQGDKNWETELKEFIVKTQEEVQREKQEKEAQQREYELTKQFEDKFARGMNRYADFADVVKGKPITDAMMLATRSMNDPAAFLYAASKTQPKEIERIAQIRDPYQQIAEIGRLEERMKKVRTQTAASKPIPPTKGDVNNTPNHRGSIDALILNDAKRKFRR